MRAAHRYGLPADHRPALHHRPLRHAGCTIGENSLVGIGAIILNGTRVGKNCIIGAHTLLPEGKEVPDNSLVVGSPGRVVRQLGEKDALLLARLSSHYVQNWQHYSKNLKLVPQS